LEQGFLEQGFFGFGFLGWARAQQAIVKEYRSQGLPEPAAPAPCTICLHDLPARFACTICPHDFAQRLVAERLSTS
jgi:hypothetical protein